MTLRQRAALDHLRQRTPTQGDAVDIVLWAHTVGDVELLAAAQAFALTRRTLDEAARRLGTTTDGEGEGERGREA